MVETTNTANACHPDQVDDRNFVRRFFFPLRNQKGYEQHPANRSSSWNKRQKQTVDNRHDGNENDIGEHESGVSDKHFSQQHNALEKNKSPSSTRSVDSVSSGNFITPQMVKEDLRFVNKFWTTYDDLLILSIFTQVGILFRLFVSTWFTFFDSVFSNDTSLFVNLPLNCFSCFGLGLLCSGEQLMEVIATRFSPSRTQQQIQQGLMEPELRAKSTSATDEESGDDDIEMMDIGSSINVSTQEVFDFDDDQNDTNEDDYDDEDGAMRRPRSGLFRRKRTRGRQRLPMTDGCDDDHDGQRPSKTKFTRRRPKRQKAKKQEKRWEPVSKLNNELRDVQLLALERRIRMSKCLVLFPAEQQDVDVMEHYFNTGYRKERHNDEEAESMTENNNVGNKFNTKRKNEISSTFNDDRVSRSEIGLDLQLSETRNKKKPSKKAAIQAPTAEENDKDAEIGKTTSNKAMAPNAIDGTTPTDDAAVQNSTNKQQDDKAAVPATQLAVTITEGNEDSHSEVFSDGETTATTTDENNAVVNTTTTSTAVDQMITDVTANVTENISRLRRVNLADGWDAGTSPSAMADDLLLGLRAGFCGALSSFSSWNSAMVNLLLQGRFGEATVGYMLGLQLPIIAYRFGQHVAVYIFMWRVRSQSRRAERRGYGLKISQNDDSDHLSDGDDDDASAKKDEKEIPSVRAFVTAIFIMALVTQCTSLFLYQDPLFQQLALSLLFSPLGVIARWRLMRCNQWRPDFPVGTFTANLLACALGGSLGSLLAGNPGPRTRIVLVSFISGFGGTLSSVGAFIEEILAGVDPILFRFDGIIYAITSIVAAMVVVIIFQTSEDWADQVGWSNTTVSSSNDTSSILVDLLMNNTSNKDTDMGNLTFADNTTMPTNRFTLF